MQLYIYYKQVIQYNVSNNKAILTNRVLFYFMQTLVLIQIHIQNYIFTFVIKFSKQEFSQ